MSDKNAAINRTRLFELFREMVDIYSPSGKEEELAGFLAQYISAHGLRVELQPVDETRNNLLVTNSATVDCTTLFLGHIDTVPAYDYENYDFAERDGECHGLGTADMKSGCAAMLEAFIVLHERGKLPDNVMLALVVGEEESGDGTQALLETHRFSNALVAEPTNLMPCLSHYGYIEMLVRAFGYRRHAAMSGRETNAIRAMLHLLLNIEDRIEQNEPETVLNIRDLHSSESGFAVPDRCAASVDFHIPPGISAENYTAGVRLFVEENLLKSGISRHEIELPTCTDGFLIEERDLLPQQLRGIYADLNMEWTLLPFRSHSDANLLRDAGCKPLMLGPGLLAKAHTRDESVASAQVAAAAEVYARLLIALGERGNF